MKYFDEILSHIQGKSNIKVITDDTLVVTVSTKNGRIPGGFYEPGKSYCSLIDEDKVSFVSLKIDKTKAAAVSAELFKQGEIVIDADDAVTVSFLDEEFGVVIPDFHRDHLVEIYREAPDSIRVRTQCRFNQDDTWFAEIKFSD